MFSPGYDHILAVGSHDQFIYVCDASLALKKRLVGATASLLALSFAEDGRTLISNSRDYEILYANLT